MQEQFQNETLAQPPMTHAEVYEQYAQNPNANPDLLTHMQRLANEESQTAMAVVADVEGREAGLPTHEISPEHHEEHIKLAEPMVPDIAEKPEAEQDLIGELLEIGETAIDDAAEQPAAASLLASSGSLKPTWKERAFSAQQLLHKQYRNEGKTAIGESGRQHGYQIDKVPVALPINPDNTEAIQYQSLSEMSDEEKTLHGVATEAGGRVDFDSLDGHTKDALFTARLIEVEAISRDINKRRDAMQKNLDRVERGVIIEGSDYVHGFNADAARNILKTGLVAGEGIGQIGDRKPGSDVYPFNLDLVAAESMLNGPIKDGKINNHLRYGNVQAVVDRAGDAMDKGNEATGLNSKDHVMIFGGLPSTDIRAFQIQSDSDRFKAHPEEYNQTRDKLLNDIVAEGLYVPVYDTTGTLLMNYDDYAKRRQTHDYIDDFLNEPRDSVTAEVERKQAEAAFYRAEQDSAQQRGLTVEEYRQELQREAEEQSAQYRAKLESGEIQSPM